jgi:hypothetical protein
MITNRVDQVWNRISELDDKIGKSGISDNNKWKKRKYKWNKKYFWDIKSMNHGQKNRYNEKA